MIKIAEEENQGLKSLVVASVIVVVLAVSVLLGIAIMGGFSKATRTLTIDNESAENTLTPILGTPILVGTSGEFPFLQDLTLCVNSSNGSRALTKTTDYKIFEGTKNGGTMNLTNTLWNNTAINCSRISYLASSSAQVAADTFITGLTIFGTFIGVIIIGVIGFVLIRMFRKTS